MRLHDLSEFLRLSALLNLQLAATAVGPANVVSAMLGGKALADRKRDVLYQALSYLEAAYGERKQRLGPLAVLHPLRTAALLARASDQPSLGDLLTAMLHDKLEDITPTSVGAAQWRQAEDRFSDLLASIDPADEWYLMERLEWLTRRPAETYFHYIGRLLDHADRSVTPVRVKLADRLDNVLNLRVDLDDPFQGVDFFAIAFDTLFVSAFQGYRPALPHPPPSPLNGAQRLYQLFKAAIVLSLVRQRRVGVGDPICRRLIEALATAAMNEAERIALHIFAYHLTDVETQRRLLLDVMSYAHSGRIDQVTLPGTQHRLDGLLLSFFNEANPQLRGRSLEELYRDKSLMVEAAVSFIAVFRGFLADDDYFIGGLSEAGLSALG